MADLALPRHARARHRRRRPALEWIAWLLSTIIATLTSTQLAETALAIALWTLAVLLAGLAFLLVVLVLSVAMVIA